jgi:hypothetical protein
MISDIRFAVSDAIATAFTIRESPWISDGPFRDPSVSQNGAFAVTVPRTDVVENRRARANGDGIVCKSSIRVRVLLLMRGDAAVEDYVTALDFAAALAGVVGAVKSDAVDHSQLALQSLTYDPIGDDTAILVTGEWTVMHQLFVYPHDYTPPE